MLAIPASVLNEVPAFLSQTQIFQNPAKPRQAQPRTTKEKRLDFLGFAWRF
jgi:hypothetical protein